ncbi:Uncharacterised protein [Bordetella pertussis]|nr:Uncharacterised protein [Bordetella pertussis]
MHLGRMAARRFAQADDGRTIGNTHDFPLF